MSKYILLNVAFFALMIFSAGCNSSSHAVDVVEGPDGRQPVKVADAEAYKPTLLPDRIILTWTGDPSRTQAVTWRTSTAVAKGLAEIAVATDPQK